MELKKESLVKALIKYSVNVEFSLMNLIDSKLIQALSKFIEMFEERPSTNSGCGAI